jgi:hypothetical protein
MFFKREKPQKISFAARLDQLRSAGFQVTPSGGNTRIVRGECAIDFNGEAAASRAGMLIGSEIGALVDGGYQKFFQTPSGHKRPALAADLRALHEFEEDLKEGLGLESLYNESLGTVSTFYLYDRVKDRDRGVPKRVWE